MSLQKLWVKHQTIPKTYGPTKVSIDGCEYVDDFLKEIKKATLLAIPPKSPIALYQPDGMTEIDVGDSPALFVDGNSRQNPLVVKTIPVDPMDIDQKPYPFVRNQSDEEFIHLNQVKISTPGGAQIYLEYLFHKLVNLDLEQLKAKANAASFSLVVLLAVSCAGKTRTLLELLHDTPGYYFTANTSSDFGSQDLKTCKMYCDLHTDRVKHAISLLYCIRKFVCSYVQTKLGFGAPGILLAQLHPKQFFGSDIYTSLFEALIEDSLFNSNFEQKSFDFVAIDEIQDTLKLADDSDGYHVVRNKRSFFTPLVYYSKTFQNFPCFLVSGTGINYPELRDALKSIAVSTTESSTMTFETISAFRPLTWEETEDFSARYLTFRRVEEENIRTFLSRIKKFELCHGRARFLAFILENFLQTQDIDQALRQFSFTIHDVDSVIYPLRFVVDDMKSGKFSGRLMHGVSLETLIIDAIYSYLTTGSGILRVFSDDIPLMVTFGIGFVSVTSGVVRTIEIKELAVIECLRKFVSISKEKLVQSFAVKKAETRNPHSAGYLLEYLVAFAVVAKYEGTDAAEKIKPFMYSPTNYLSLVEQDGPTFYFPDHLCGPDIIFKCFKTKTVYIVQVKFLKAISRQELIAACDTTDYTKFYCKRGTNEILPGFQDHRKKLLEGILQLQRSDWNIQQLMVLHTGNKGPTYEKGVQEITKKTAPDFFASTMRCGIIWIRSNVIFQTANKAFLIDIPEKIL